MREAHVIVVGAGIGGLAAALALARSGQRVTVCEQATQLGEVGAGLSITPNAGKALRALGLEAELEAIGSVPPVGAIQHYATQEVLVPLGQDESRTRYGISLYHVHRADLHSALANALQAIQPDALRLGKALVDLDANGTRVRARFADGATIESDALIGADGIHSAARALLFGQDHPNFTGYVAWRGLVPAERAPRHLFEPPLLMSVGPRRMLMRYPLRRRTLINYVALARREAWMEEGWSVRSELSEVLEEFRDFAAPTRELLELTPPDRLFKWGIFDRDPLPTWTRGRASLLGDAAHAMPPFTGQGAVMALEDAVILGRAFATAGAIEEALRRYEGARHARVTAALAMSRARARLYFADDPRQQVQALGAGMAELRTLYAYDAGDVPL